MGDSASARAGTGKAFLTHLAVGRRVAGSMQGQALAALPVLYRDVLGRQLLRLGEIPWARAPVRLPVVLTRGEVEPRSSGSS